MSTITIHRTHAKLGFWRSEVPENVFRRESVDGVDFLVTTRNYYLEGATGKVRYTKEDDTVHDVYLVRGNDAVFACHLPHRETLKHRMAIPMASDGRSLLDHVREALPEGGAFDKQVAATAPAPAEEEAPSAPGM